MDTEAKRGKLEKSFTAIGSAVCIGSGLGGTYGLFTGEERRRDRAVKCCNDGCCCGAGLRQTANMQGALRRTQLMNYTLKSGGLVSNAFGTIAVSYSLLHCLLVNGETASVRTPVNII